MFSFFIFFVFSYIVSFDSYPILSITDFYPTFIETEPAKNEFFDCEIDNCKFCFPNKNICDACAYGFYLLNNFCYECPQACSDCYFNRSIWNQNYTCSFQGKGYFLKDISFEPCQSNCILCNSAFNCLKCEFGFYLTFRDFEAQFCQSCSFLDSCNNCALGNATSLLTGSDLKSIKNQTEFDSLKLVYKWEIICLSCDSLYKTISPLGKCLLCSQLIPECQTCSYGNSSIRNLTEHLDLHQNLSPFLFSSLEIKCFSCLERKIPSLSLYNSCRYCQKNCSNCLYYDNYGLIIGSNLLNKVNNFDFREVCETETKCLEKNTFDFYQEKCKACPFRCEYCYYDENTMAIVCGFCERNYYLFIEAIGGGTCYNIEDKNILSEDQFILIKSKYKNMSCSRFFVYYDLEILFHRCQIYDDYNSLKYRKISEKNNNELNCFSCSYENCYETYKGVNLTYLLVHSPRKLIDLYLKLNIDEIEERCTLCENGIYLNICVSTDYDRTYFENKTLILNSNYDSIYYFKKLHSFLNNITFFNEIFPNYKYYSNYINMYEQLKNPKIAFSAKNNYFCPLSTYNCFEFTYLNQSLIGNLSSFNMFLNYVNSSLDCKKGFIFSQIKLNNKLYSICRFCPNNWANCLAEINVKIYFNKSATNETETNYININNIKEFEELLSSFKDNFQFFFMSNTFFVEKITFILIFENQKNDFSSFGENATYLIEFTKDLSFFCKQVQIIFQGNNAYNIPKYPTIYISSFIKFYGFFSVSFQNLTFIIDDTDKKNNYNSGVEIDSISILELSHCNIFYLITQNYHTINFPFFIFGKDGNPLNLIKLNYIDLKIISLFSEDLPLQNKTFIKINTKKIDIYEFRIIDSYLFDISFVMNFFSNLESNEPVFIESLMVYNSTISDSSSLQFVNKNNINNILFPSIIFNFFALVNCTIIRSNIIEIYDMIDFQINEFNLLYINFINSSLFMSFNRNMEQYNFCINLQNIILAFSTFDTYLVFPKICLLNISNVYLNSNTFLCEQIEIDVESFFQIPSKFDGGFFYLKENNFLCPDSSLYLIEKTSEQIISNSTFIFENQTNISFILFVNLSDTILKNCKFADLSSNSDRFLIKYEISEAPLEISFCDFIGFSFNDYKIFIPILRGRDIFLLNLRVLYVKSLESQAQRNTINFIEILNEFVILKNENEQKTINVYIINSVFENFILKYYDLTSANIISINYEKSFINMKNVVFKNILLELKCLIIYVLCQSLKLENFIISNINQTSWQRSVTSDNYIFLFQLLDLKLKSSHFEIIFLLANFMKIEVLSGRSKITIQNSSFLNIICYSLNSILYSSHLFFFDCSLSVNILIFEECAFENNISLLRGGNFYAYGSKSLYFLDVLFRNYLPSKEYLTFFSDCDVIFSKVVFYFDSTMENNLTISDSPLIQVISSDIYISDCYFYGVNLIDKLSKLINLIVSTFNSESVLLENLHCNSEVVSTLNSNINWNLLVVLNVDIINYQTSDILIDKLSLFDFQSDSLVEIKNSVFFCILSHVSFNTYLMNSERGILVLNNVFIWNFEGSSLITISASPQKEDEFYPYNLLEKNKFYQIRGKENGGCLNIYQASCNITENLFHSCITSQGEGGAVYYIGNMRNYIEIKNNTFIENFAFLGGAIYYFILFKKNFRQENVFINNNSSYPFGMTIFSFPRKLILNYNSEIIDLTTQNFYSIKKFRSGEYLQNLYLATYSEENELIVPTILNAHFIKLTFPDNSFKNIFQNEKGFFNISGFAICFQPNSTMNIILSAEFVFREEKSFFKNDINTILSIEFRLCEIGEIFNSKTNLACVPCDTGKYSYDPNEETCKECPNGADCNVKSNGIFEVKSGFFRFKLFDQILFFCYKLPENCVGGFGKEEELCYEGHIGARCEACDYYSDLWKESYAKGDDLTCIKCKEVNYNLLFFFLNFVIFFFLLGGSIYGIKQTVEGKRNKEKEAGFGYILKILITYFQINSCVFTFKLPAILNFSSNFRKVESPIAVVLFSLDCWLGNIGRNQDIPRVYLKLIIGVLMPFLFFIVSEILLGLYQLKYKKISKKPLTTMILLFIFIYFQKSLTTQIMKSISCSKIGETYFLKSDVNYFCYSSTFWYFTFLLSIPLFIFVVFMIPGFIFYKINKNEKNKNSLDFLMKYGYIYNEYKVPYWEIVKMTEKVLLVCILDFYEDELILKGSLILAVIFIYLLLMIHKKPYRHGWVNNLEQFMTIICFKSILLCIILTDSSFTYINYSGMIVLFLINLIFLAKISLLFFKILRSNVSNLLTKGSIKNEGNNLTTSRKEVNLELSICNLDKNSDKNEEISKLKKKECFFEENKIKFIKEVFSEIESEGEKGDIN